MSNTDLLVLELLPIGGPGRSSLYLMEKLHLSRSSVWNALVRLEKEGTVARYTNLRDTRGILYRRVK